MITVYHMNDEAFGKCPPFANDEKIAAFARATLAAGWYVKVATVNSDDLDDAYRGTQNIDRSWTENFPEVTAHVKERDARSTSVGDLLVLHAPVASSDVYNDVAYIVASFGFARVYPP